jgi:hypothetical protein
MKYDLCDYRITCLYSHCCSLETFKNEFYMINFIFLTLTIIASGIGCVFILKDILFSKKNTAENININNNSISNNMSRNLKGSHDSYINNKDQNYNFKKNEYNADGLSAYNISNVVINLYLKGFMVYLLISKILEVKVVGNYLQPLESGRFSYINDSEEIAWIVFKLTAEFFAILFAFSVIQFGGHILEYHKKLIIILIIYLILGVDYFLVNTNRTLITYNVYYLNTYVIITMIVMLIVLVIHSNKVFFAKLSIGILIFR